MKQEVRQEIKYNQVLLDAARDHIVNAWINGNVREQDRWEKWANELENRIEYLCLTINKGA